MLGTRLGWFEINLQFCWPSPKAVFSTWYIFATIVFRMDALPHFFFYFMARRQRMIGSDLGHCSRSVGRF